MHRLSQSEIRNNAITFVHEWKDETRERAESQTFWNEFLAIFGVKRRRVAIFEKAVPKNNLNTGSIDLFWRGVLLVEHKSRGQNFDRASSQAFEYLENLSENELPEYVLISDFGNFRLYNLETKEEVDFPLEELPDLIHLFGAISGYEKREYREQDPVNIKVALKLGELHDALFESGYRDHQLETFLVRLVYCLFADDTGVFLPRGSFQLYLEEKTAEDGSNLGAMLGQIFQVLDTPDERRQTTLDEDLRAFQYVNGSLFAERMDMPSFDRRMRTILIEACKFNWGKVSPAIFGSLFQSVMDKEKRRNLGAHYTSEKNILKVIHGLFMDDLLAEFEAVKNNLTRLRAFHEKIAGLKFFDPACGSGNFLVITYREMRRLELEIIKQERHLTKNTQREMRVTDLSRLDVDSFYGIEYEEFPAEIARVALWLTDHLANMELSAELGVPYARLPLQHSPNIVHGNALRMDWADVLAGTQAILPAMSANREIGTPQAADAGGTPAFQSLYILGNPPFVGGKMMNEEQRADMAVVCSDVPNFGLLDYVCAWYIKAAKLLGTRSLKATNNIASGETRRDVARDNSVPERDEHSTKGLTPTGSVRIGDADVGFHPTLLSLSPLGIPAAVRVAFVSTNSITQGEQVGVLWNYLLENNIKIHFAHRTFKWSNEAAGKAAVFCVIIGFGSEEIKKKRLFDYDDPKAEPQEIPASNINPYLVDAADTVITNRRTPLSNVPEIVFGNMPNDGGHLLLTREEKDRLISAEPDAGRFIRPFLGAYEFINGIERFCIWLKDADPTDWRYVRGIVERVQRVREHRQGSNRKTTQQLAQTPFLFGEIRHPDSDYIMIPSVSSENRRYVPIGFMPKEVIASNLVLFVPNATLYHFGVLTSTMHNAWMRQVCGRLESRYRYSKDIVYNNFPWPAEPTDKQKERIEQTAQAILDARAKFPDATLADLYDPLTMPKELLDVHRANDEAVDAAYGKRRFANELERLEFLFALYRQYTEPIRILEEKALKKARRR